MITIIAGTRTINNYSFLLDEIRNADFEITEVVSGGCVGADKLGERLARESQIPLHVFYAKWNTQGKAAGPIRNKEMIEFADAVIALWDGKSRGTMDLLKQAKEAGLRVHIGVI